MKTMSATNATLSDLFNRDESNHCCLYSNTVLTLKNPNQEAGKHADIQYFHTSCFSAQPHVNLISLIFAF